MSHIYKKLISNLYYYYYYYNFVLQSGIGIKLTFAATQHLTDDVSKV